MYRIWMLLTLQVLICQTLSAGGVRGFIKNEKREPLAYATIFIHETGTGTVTNEDGYYEINLPPGSYEFVYQFLGYETVVRKIGVGSDFVSEDVILRQQAMELGTVDIVDGREDPAYTIMRKAIAKASYHRQQVDAYTANVYIKGSGRLLGSPALFRKMIEKEGVDSTTAFLSESVSEISYRRPNTYNERVISIRKQGNDNATSPAGYINASFYDPTLNDVVSPLSPRAFAYYKFTFEGSYIDRGYEVNKIKVTPRQAAEGVFSGTIYIVEDWWSIHSLYLRTYKLGIGVDIHQVFAPIEDKVWMPVTQKYYIKGKFFGFEFEYNYLATVSHYKIHINPDLDAEFSVVDEKIEPERAATIEKQLDPKAASIQEKLASGQELTRKELRQVMREYMKEERKEETGPEVVENYTYSVDSSAQNRDTAFWEQVRPIPLTAYELKSYQKVDSIAMVEASGEGSEDKKSSEKAKKKSRKFDLEDLIMGDAYKIKGNTDFVLGSVLGSLQYNTVEGYALELPLSVRNARTSDKKETIRTRREWKFGGVPRYAFAREKLSAKGFFNHYRKMDLRETNFRLEGGRYIFQLNENNPISPAINTMWTLIGERNYMKLYEKDYVKGTFRKDLRDNFSVSAKLEWARRYQLENEALNTWFDYKKRSFSSNIPVNREVLTTEFPQHEALTARLGFQWRPWQKYRLRNGRKEVLDQSSPEFSGQFTTGLRDWLGSDVGYDLIELGMKKHWTFPAGSVLSLKLAGGIFLRDDQVYFPDFKHFPGNRTELVTSDPVESYRLLDYYERSTKDRFLQVHVHHQFRKFAWTRIPELWMIGLKENLIAGYLGTPDGGHFLELGYGIDHIFKIFRIEFVAGFDDFQYENFGIRIGIASSFGRNLNISGSDNEVNAEIKL